jgi:hypothetical protein
MPAAAMTNARRRAAVLSGYEAQLLDMWPDRAEASEPGFASFDDIEAAAAMTGDALARETMEQEITRAVALSETEVPYRCDECGSKLKRVEIPRGVSTVRGPVNVSRPLCHCPTRCVGRTSDADASGRKCRKASFPL